MPILIDGHNLIGHLPHLSLADPDDEAKLVQMLLSYHARTGKSITVVFDPGTAGLGGAASSPLSRRRGPGKVQTVFAPLGSSADALIARRVRQSSNPQGWMVVTSDRTLRQTVAGLGARVRSADDFAVELIGQRGDSTPIAGRGASLPPEEVEKWLDLFEHGEDTTQ